MLAAAFALTNCSEQIVPPVQEGDSIVEEKVETSQVEEVPFEVFAQSEDAETKTSATGSKGYLKWEAGDELNVFHSQAGKNSYSKHGKFVVDANNNGAERGLFIGNLILSDKVQLHENNDWFFLYPYSSDDTPTVTIGSAANGVQVQDGANSKKHIAGPNYPMFGKVQNVPKSKNPATNMKHLSALAAIKVVNNGSGQPIVVTSVGLKAKVDIVGSFTVGLKNNELNIATVKDGTSKTATLELSTPVTIAYGESATFYMAVKPFTTNTKDLTLYVNGVGKTITKEAEVNFTQGKVTTLSVKVHPLSYPTDNDALEMTSGGNKVFDMSDATAKTMVVNGETITGYVLGEGGKESLTVTGTVKDLMNALDVGFNASSWKGQRTAMTVDHLNLWIEGTQFANYKPFLNAIKADLGVSGLKWLAMEAGVRLLFSSGVDRTGTLMGLTDFMDPSNITFVGVVENGTSAPASGETPNIVLVSENEINKEVSSAAVENLLKTKFDYQQADGTMLIPTFEGLNDIINGNPNSAAANETANAIYNKLQASIGNKSFTADGIGTLHVWKIFQGIFSSAEDMKAKLPNLKVSVDIATIPYSAEKGAYGSKGNPKTPSGSYNPIVIWGLDVTTAAEKQQMGN